MLDWLVVIGVQQKTWEIGKSVPPDNMPPRACAPGTESLVKNGFDYARAITGEGLDSFEHQASDTAPRLDDATVTMANEVLEELGLDESELLSDSDVAPPSVPPVAATPSVVGTCTYTDMSPPPLNPIGLSSESTNITPPAVRSPCDTTPSTLSPAPTIHWKNTPLPSVAPLQKKGVSVSRLRSIGSDVTCVTPDFNDTMKAIWEQLFDTMPRSGKIGAVVHKLQEKYKERRERETRDTQESTILFPVSLAYAKTWLLKQQKLSTQAIEMGTVNEEAREFVAELHQSLLHQPPSITALLHQPAQAATPVIPPAQLSLGPPVIPDTVRAVERKELTGKGPRILQPESSKPKPPKRPKTGDPVIEERQKRATARMSELRVTPIDINEISSRKATMPCLSSIHDKTADEKIHRVLGRSNAILCPYADDHSILEAFEKEQKERKLASWRRASEKKKIKKEKP